MNTFGLVATALVLTTSVWVLIDAISIGIKKTPETAQTGKSALNMSAGVWFLCCLLFWILCFPLYLVKRGKHLAQIKNRASPNDRALIVSCPSCGLGISVAADLFGQVIGCPTCQSEFLAPQPPRQSWYHGATPAAIGYVIYAIALVCFGLSFVMGGVVLTRAQLETQVRENIESNLRVKTLNKTEVKSFNLVHESGNKYKGILIAKTGASTETAEVDVTYDGETFLWQILPLKDATTPSASGQEKELSASTVPDDSPRKVENHSKAIQTEFNTSEKAVLENGNLAVAVEKLKISGAKSVEKTSIVEVTKNPYSALGKVCTFRGQAVKIEALPPNPDMQGTWTDILVAVQNANSPLGVTTVEFICKGDMTSVNAGNYITVSGYFVGTYESQNAIGGTVEGLMLVGDSLKK